MLVELLPSGMTTALFGIFVDGGGGLTVGILFTLFDCCTRCWFVWSFSSLFDEASAGFDVDEAGAVDGATDVVVVGLLIAVLIVVFTLLPIYIMNEWIEKNINKMKKKFLN